MQKFASLLQAPSPAGLATCRKDGTAAASPIWFRFRDGCFEVVIAEDDVKLRRLAARPECSLVVFEAAPPFRAVRIGSVRLALPRLSGLAAPCPRWSNVP
jgi:Pyridoxamine 5'-phosphate oxidase